MAKGLRKKGQSDLLNKLVCDCITFGLKEKEALEYIEKEFGEPLSKRAYWDRRRRVLRNNSQNRWMDHFTRIGFVQNHRRQIEDIQKIQDDSMHRFYELTNPPKNILANNRRGDENLILKLKEDIRVNARLLSELGIGTPIIAAIKRRIEDAYSFQTNLKNINANSSDDDNADKYYAP